MPLLFVGTSSRTIICTIIIISKIVIYRHKRKQKKKGISVIWSNKSEKMYRRKKMWRGRANDIVIYFQCFDKNGVMNNVLCWLLTDDYDGCGEWYTFLFSNKPVWKGWKLGFVLYFTLSAPPIQFCFHSPKMQFFLASFLSLPLEHPRHSDKKSFSIQLFIRLPFIDVPVCFIPEPWCSMCTVMYFLWVLEQVLEWIQSRMFNKILTVTIYGVRERE